MKYKNDLEKYFKFMKELRNTPLIQIYKAKYLRLRKFLNSRWVDCLITKNSLCYYKIGVQYA